ncbi:MAG TPA: hypothetical protein VIF09_18980 [Polyangiaceae bacterium]|jgi:hypothetical protein
MGRRPLLVVGGLVAVALAAGSWVMRRNAFPPDATPEGAYARIAYAVGQQRIGDAFAYLETDAQWAAWSVRDLRRKARDRVRASYPADAAKPLLDAWGPAADASDGADVFAWMATTRGWVARLERDTSGVAHVEIAGERATVVTARGTRYPFRRRDNGIWGLTIFTAELASEAERAARDLEIVQRAAADYERAAADR